MFCCLTASAARALLCMANVEFRIQGSIPVSPALEEDVMPLGHRGDASRVNSGRVPVH